VTLNANLKVLTILKMEQTIQRQGEGKRIGVPPSYKMYDKLLLLYVFNCLQVRYCLVYNIVDELV